MNQEAIEQTMEDLFNILCWGELPTAQQFADYFRSRVKMRSQGEVGYFMLEKLEPFVHDVMALLEDEYGE
jgi:hypothetical protein